MNFMKKIVCVLTLLSSIIVYAKSEKITGFQNAILDNASEIQTLDEKRITSFFTDSDLSNELNYKDITIPNGSVISVNPKIRVEAKGFQMFTGNIKGIKNDKSSKI